MLCPLCFLPYSFFFSWFFICFLLSHFILAVPMRRCSGRHLRRCSGRHLRISSVFTEEELGVTCFFSGQSVLDCAEASTVKTKLLNYCYCNYVIVVHFSYVIFISNSMTVSNAPWNNKVVLQNVFAFYHVSCFRGVWMIFFPLLKVEVKSSMARSFPVENLLPLNAGSIIDYLQ